MKTTALSLLLLVAMVLSACSGGAVAPAPTVKAPSGARQ